MSTFLSSARSKRDKGYRMSGYINTGEKLTKNILRVALTEKRLLAKNTFRFPRCAEPLVQTRGVEFIFASRTLESRERERFGIEDRITNRTWFYSFKLFVNILFPKENGIKDGSIVMREELDDLEEFSNEIECIDSPVVSTSAIFLR